jgi:hypothetical protein
VAVHLGEKPSAGHEVYVEAVKRTRSAELEVVYVVKSPPRGQPTASVMTSPFVLIRVERVAGNFTFTRKDLVTRIVPAIRCRCGCGHCRY